MMGSMFIRVTDDSTGTPYYLNGDYILKFEEIKIEIKDGSFDRGTVITLAVKELDERAESDLGYQERCVMETPEDVDRMLT